MINRRPGLLWISTHNYPAPVPADAVQAPRWVDWSLVKDAKKYNEAARLDDLMTLRSLINGAPASASVLPTPSPLATTVVANPIQPAIEAGSGEKVEGEIRQSADGQTEQKDVEESKKEKTRKRLILGTALRYLDVTDLARSCCVSRTWRGTFPCYVGPPAVTITCD